MKILVSNFSAYEAKKSCPIMVEFLRANFASSMFCIFVFHWQFCVTAEKTF